MRKTAVLGILALALLAQASVSWAATVTFCDSRARQTLRDMTLTVPAFPYSECGLTGAQVTLEVTVDGQFYGENTGSCLPSGCAWADTNDVWLVLNDLNGTALNRQYRYAASGTLQGYDGVMDFGGPSGYTSPYSWAAFSSFGMTYPNLALFSNPVSVPIDTDAFSRLHNPGNGTYGVSTYITASLCVTYSYECVIGVQPSPWARVKGLYRD